MKPELVLAIDLSSKTGWALVTSYDLGMKVEDYGTVPQIHQPKGEYPSNYVLWAYSIFREIDILIKRFNPDVLVIEETSKGSKNAMSQKLLEFSHFLLAKYITDNGVRSVYIMTEEWRREIGCKMNNEEKIRNKQSRKYKKEHNSTISYDINGKRTGLIGRKHVNIRRVSEIFNGQLKEPLKRKSEDQADALGLIACYHFRRFNSKNQAREMTLEELVGSDK